MRHSYPHPFLLLFVRSTIIATLLLLAIGTLAEAARADTLHLAWDPVDDDRLALYQVGWWDVNGANTNTADVPSTQAAQVTDFLTPDLPSGEYFFAVRACGKGMTNCSDWSNEVFAIVRGPLSKPGNCRFITN